VDKSLVVRLRTPPAGGGPPFRFGSGYLIGPEWVLTAGHTLRPPEDDSHVPVTGDRCQVLPWGGDPELGWLPGQVEHCEVELDLAIVSVPGLAGSAEPVRWGRLAGSEPVPWKAIGFPVAGLDDSGRQPETAWGEVSPATQEPAGKLGLVIGSRAARLTPGGTSGWAGLSGAAVFSHDRLVGVIIEDPPEFAGSLTARRIDCLAGHPLLYEAAGSPVIEAVSADSADDSGWISRHAEAMKREFLTRLGGGQAVSAAVAGERYADVLVRPRPAVSGAAIAGESRAVPLSGCLSPPDRRLILIGGGGMGKTTILLKTVIDLCERARADHGVPAAVYARLNFFDAQANAFGELMNIISRSAQLDRADAEALWAQRRRPCVFLLDGFNEVNPLAREACALALSELLQHRWHSYVITSRPGDDVDKLALRLDAELLEIVSLDDDQVQKFLDSYGLSDLPGRIGPRLKDFLRTPFLLWALAQSQAGMPGGELPSNTGRLYKKLIDNYIFESREQAKTGDARPTRYHYELVKKPVLGEIAAQMCVAGVTRRPEDRDLLVTMRDRLREIRAEYEGIYPIVPYELMPDPPAATELLEEAARNGIIRRADATVEFAHESIRDYFAAVEMVDWPLTRTVTNLHALIWRHVRPDLREYRVGSSMAGPITMIAGLCDNPEPLVRALADRNLLIAASCHAEAPTTGAADYLAGLLRPMLQHWQPARRWIGCQCLGQAGLQSENLIASLLELAWHDPEWQVRDAAARALGRIDDHRTIQQLVTDALTDAMPDSPSEFGERKTARILWALYSKTAVRRVFDAWRSEAADTDRGARARQLLATMNPGLVRATLHAIATKGRIQGDNDITQDAERALSQLDSWKGDGLPAAERLVYAAKSFLERSSREVEAKLTVLSTYSTAELFTHVHGADAITRVAAVTLLQQRNEPTAVIPFLEALGTETDHQVRGALLKALRPLANQPGFLSAWSDRLTDPGWSQVAILDPALSAHLPPLGPERLDTAVPLDPDIRADLTGQGVSVDDDASIIAQPSYWDLTPGARGGRRYENEHSRLRIVPSQGQLHIEDLGKSARLVMAGAALGDRAVPVLRRLLQTDPPSPFMQEAVPEALAAIDTPAAAHELCAMLLTAEEGNQPIDLAGSRPWKAIAGIRSPYATEELLKTLRILTLARLRHYQDLERPPAASPEPDLTRLNGAAGALITALLAIGAQTQLAQFAHEAFVREDDILRHVATVTAARLDVLAPCLDELLIRAVHATIAATRLVAAQALGQHETPSRRAALVDACLNDQDEEVRTAAATAIRGYQGDEGIYDLISHLAQGEPALRARAADALGLIGDELAVTPLADALSDGPPRLQISAAHALRLLEPPHADRIIGPLITVAATDPDAEIRSLAAKELDQVPGGTERLIAPVYDALNAGRYLDALSRLGDNAPLIVDSAELRCLRAWTLRELQRLPEALDDIDAVLRELGDFAAALSLRADLLFSLDRGDEGLTAIKEAAKRRPDDAELQAELGRWSYVSGCLDESIQASRHAIELKPDSVEARLNLGLALLANGDDALAEQTYQQAIEQGYLGDRSKGITRLATAIEELGELEQQTGAQKTITSTIRTLLQAGVDNLNAIQRGSAAADIAAD
jgi:HEAT repeat protein/Tfp pilus assembly protein PilF